MSLRERLAASAAEIRTRSQRLVELTAELLTAELKRKGQRYGAGVGALVAAGVFALYALGFALATIAVALALVLPLWLALLIVTAVLALIVMILALVGRSRLRRAKASSSRRTVAEAKATVDTLKTNLRQTAGDLALRRNGKAPPSGDGSTPATGHAAPSPGAAPTRSASPTATPPTTPPGAPTPTPREMPRETPPSDDEVL
jgi:hypothetical protein